MKKEQINLEDVYDYFELHYNHITFTRTIEIDNIIRMIISQNTLMINIADQLSDYIVSQGLADYIVE